MRASNMIYQAFEEGLSLSSLHHIALCICLIKKTTELHLNIILLRHYWEITEFVFISCLLYCCKHVINLHLQAI